jgi:hypothetical protein
VRKAVGAPGRGPVAARVPDVFGRRRRCTLLAAPVRDVLGPHRRRTFLAATFPGRDVSWPHWDATLGRDAGDGEGLRRIVSLRSGCITPHRHQLSDTPGDLIGCLAYRLIWRSDSRVSAVVLGAMRTGEWRWQPSGG